MKRIGLTIAAAALLAIAVSNCVSTTGARVDPKRPPPIPLYENRYVGQFPGVKLGMGVSTLVGGMAAPCLAEFQEGQCSDGAKKIEFHKRFISESSQMRQAMQASFAASYGGGVFSARARGGSAARHPPGGASLAGVPRVSRTQPSQRFSPRRTRGMPKPPA